MRALSERAARSCEEAKHPACKCRCRGKLHGAKRIAENAPREEYERLPEDDPHKLMKDKRNREKESPHWKPAKWTPAKVVNTVRRAYRKCEEEMAEIIGPHEARIIAARLRSERNEALSVAWLRARGVRLIGDTES